ncbi:MAG: hypothetical protein HFE84_01460 [Lachnospiraceae bacterium]|nr:hypothetical protein [Lachnospiraceae bacterium]
MAAFEKPGDRMPVADLLDHAVCEMTSQIAGLEMHLISAIPEDLSNWKTFLIRVKGDYMATVLMSAEDPVFYEIARNMKRQNEISKADIAVYVTEYFNILGGFFVSAFNRGRNLKARFGIPEYLKRAYIQNTNLNHDAVRLFYQCAYGKAVVDAMGFPF